MKSAFALATAIGLAAGLAAIPSQAPAQGQGGKVMEVLVFGSDPCPRSTEDEIVVCRRLDERERYRIPERLRTGGARQQREAWVNKTRSLEVAGRTGIMSCSAVGPGGHTGCLEQMIAQARAEAREEAQAQTPPEE